MTDGVPAPGFATQYLRQMRDFRFADYHAAAHPAGARIPRVPFLA